MRNPAAIIAVEPQKFSPFIVNDEKKLLLENVSSDF